MYKNYFIAPLDIEILLLANSLKYGMEMHDKLIVATTLFHEATLITKDRNIRKSKIIKTIW